MNNEYVQFVEELSDKFGYNDDLKSALPKVLEAFVNYHGAESKSRLFELLKNCPIFLEEQFSHEDKSETYLNNLLNGRGSSAVFKESDTRGAYGYNPGGTPTAYYSQPILNEEGKITDKVRFIVVDTIDTSFNKKYGQIFKTNVNVPHLFHELKHAYSASKDEYTQKGSQFIHRVGLAKELYEVTPAEDNKFEVERKKTSGLILEEAVNAVDQEEMTCQYLGCSKEELQEMYNEDVLIPSSYDTVVKEIGSVMYRLMGRHKVEDLRVKGNIDHIVNFNNTVKQSEGWKENTQDVSEGLSPWNVVDKSAANLFEVLGNKFKYLNKGIDKGVAEYKKDMEQQLIKIRDVFNAYQEGRQAENNKETPGETKKTAINKASTLNPGRA